MTNQPSDELGPITSALMDRLNTDLMGNIEEIREGNKSPLEFALWQINMQNKAISALSSAVANLEQHIRIMHERAGLGPIEYDHIDIRLSPATLDTPEG